MRKLVIPALAIAMGALLLSLPALAADPPCCPSGAGKAAPVKVAQSAAGPQAGMDMGKPKDEPFFTEKAKDGYTWKYDLLPMDVAGATHHLMVFVTDPSGKPVTGAKVGFDVVSPDKKKEQKVMAMGMGDGYGANLDLAVKGKYTIRTKVVGGAKQVSLNHEFVKEIK